MNNKDRNDPLANLLKAARQASDNRDTQAPLGFSTRVAAQALSAKSSGSLSSAFERLSWRALGVAAGLMLVCLVSSYHFTSSSVTTVSTEEDDNDLLNQDPVAEFIDLSS